MNEDWIELYRSLAKAQIGLAQSVQQNAADTIALLKVVQTQMENLAEELDLDALRDHVQSFRRELSRIETQHEIQELQLQRLRDDSSEL